MKLNTRNVWLVLVIFFLVIDLVSTWIILRGGGIELTSWSGRVIDRFGINFAGLIILPAFKGLIVALIWGAMKVTDNKKDDEKDREIIELARMASYMLAFCWLAYTMIASTLNSYQILFGTPIV